MKTELQKSLEVALKNAEGLRGKIADKTASAEEVESFKKYTQEAKDYASQIDADKMFEDVKEWGKKSDGTAQVPATFDRLALTEEGEMKGLTADPKTGEYRVLEGFDSQLGESNLKALQSGAYKDYFVQRIRAKALHGSDWKSYIKGNAMKILNEGSYTAGEAWIPPDFRANLVQRMGTIQSVRPNATVMTTGSDHITFPQAVYTTDDLYSSPFRGTWQGSSAQSSDPAEGTNPVAGQIRIPVYLLTANIIVQREQIEDNSFDLLGYITKIGAESFGLAEEEAFTSGNGVSKPFGFTKHPTMSIAQGSTSTVYGTTYTGGEVFTGSSGALAWGNALTPTGLFGLEASLAPQYEAGAAWYAAKSTFAGVRSINAGTATLPQWGLGVNYPNLSIGYNSIPLLDYPTKKNQFMDSVSTATTNQTPCMALGNMDGYWIADRVGFSVEVNPWVFQARDQVLIYMRKRVGGQLVEYWKMKGLVPTA